MTHFQIFPQIFLAVYCIWYFLPSSCDVSAVVVILTQLLSVLENFVKLASLSKEFSVMIMEKNRSYTALIAFIGSRLLPVICAVIN